RTRSSRRAALGRFAAPSSREGLALERDLTARPVHLDLQMYRAAAPALAPPDPGEGDSGGDDLVVARPARAGPERLEPVGGEDDRGAPLARVADEPHTGGGSRAERREGDRRQQQRHQRFDQCEPERHCTRTRPRWLTTIRRTPAPAPSTMVALSVVPRAVNRTRRLAGRLAKATPGGNGSVASVAAETSRTSHIWRESSSATSTGLPRSSASPRACRSAVERRCAAPLRRTPARGSGSRSAAPPAVTA